MCILWLNNKFDPVRTDRTLLSSVISALRRSAEIRMHLGPFSAEIPLLCARNVAKESPFTRWHLMGGIKGTEGESRDVFYTSELIAIASPSSE